VKLFRVYLSCFFIVIFLNCSLGAKTRVLSQISDVARGFWFDLNPAAAHKAGIIKYHEAGHALVASLLGYSIHKATIQEEYIIDEATKEVVVRFGVVTYNIQKDSSEQELIDRAKIFLAGDIAARLACGRTYAGKYDMQVARELVDKILQKQGEIRPGAQEELLAQYHNQTEELVAKNRKLLDTLAQELEDKKTLSGVEIKNIMERNLSEQNYKNGQ